jgi:Flp pilus assembly protein TadB
VNSIQAVMLPRKRFFLPLLAVIAVVAGFALEQAATRARQQKQMEKYLADLQQQLTVQKVKEEEYRNRIQFIRQGWEDLESLRRKEQKQGDHWLPGELDRMHKGRPLPAGEA